jgi:hypothetical protein
MVDGVDYSSKYYAEKSSQSALNAQSFAQSALETLNNVDNKVQEATDNIEIKKQDTIAEMQDIATTQKEEIENLSEQEQDKIINLGVDTRANVDLSNLSEIGEKHFLNKSQITNCITEKPQRIKYTYENGTFTLKAGSQVIVPNGVGKFDYVTIANDMSVSKYSAGNSDCVMFYNSVAKTFNFYVLGLNIFSGTSNPTVTDQWNIWYDIANNIMKKSSDKGATWTTSDMESFPIAILSRSAGNFTALKQVFNGMGYIGSTVWVDKGVKGLIPNGRNEDGSLKNIEFIQQQIIVRTVTGGTNDYVFALQYTGGVTIANEFTISDGNYLYNNAGVQIPGFEVFKVTQENGVITSFNPKQPFRAVDYNEVVHKTFVIQSYKNGTSWYRVYSDGWCEQGGQISIDSSKGEVTVSLLKTFKDTNYHVDCAGYVTTGYNDTAYTLQNASYWGQTTSSFKVYCIAGLPKPWCARGYIS